MGAFVIYVLRLCLHSACTIRFVIVRCTKNRSYVIFMGAFLLCRGRAGMGGRAELKLKLMRRKSLGGNYFMCLSIRAHGPITILPIKGWQKMNDVIELKRANKAQAFVVIKLKKCLSFRIVKTFTKFAYYRNSSQSSIGIWRDPLESMRLFCWSRVVTGSLVVEMSHHRVGTISNWMAEIGLRVRMFVSASVSNWFINLGALFTFHSPHISAEYKFVGHGSAHGMAHRTGESYRSADGKGGRQPSSNIAAKCNPGKHNFSPTIFGMRLHTNEVENFLIVTFSGSVPLCRPGPAHVVLCVAPLSARCFLIDPKQAGRGGKKLKQKLCPSPPASWLPGFYDAQQPEPSAFVVICGDVVVLGAQRAERSEK